MSSKVVYVSEHGDDANDGYSEKKALKSINIALNRGDTILLKANDVFFFKNIKLKRKYLGRYGDGNNPIVCGFKRIISPHWEKVLPNIWKICLKDNNFSGITSVGSNIENNIGCIHEYDKGKIHGKKVQYRSELKEDWDIWQTECVGRNTPPQEFDSLYLYYCGNPNELKIEFSVGSAAVQMEKSVIDGIDFYGYGFGLAAGTEAVIKNCKIDAIGGMIQIRDKGFAVFGNGIEFYVSGNRENCLVENCVISRCYDCGVTIQASNYKQATPRNIVVRNNLIYNCCQGWEDFLRNDSNVVYENCVFENNIVLNSGKTSGFGYPGSRFKYCHVLGNNFKGNKGMIIRRNLFVGGNYYCSGSYNGKYKSNVWEGNTCVIKRGDFLLGNYMGTKDVIRVPVEKGEFPTLKAATDDAISRYRELTGDETTRFVIKDSAAIDKQIKKLKKKYLKK